jgi:hypothetical protein
MLAFVMLAFVKSALERFAPLRSAFINDAPDASMRGSVLPDKSALLKMDERAFASERLVPRIIAEVKFVPEIVAFVMVEPDNWVDDIFAPAIVEPFKLVPLIFAFVILEFVKLEFDTIEPLKSAFINDAPDASNRVIEDG